LGEQSQGDDIVGLNRAFIYAGTPTVVASLWSVPERQTGELMLSFFRHLKSGKSKAALSAAQAEIRKEQPNPYYWAAFILTGDAGAPSR
jgi:CHAT domain-containing protein